MRSRLLPAVETMLTIVWLVNMQQPKLDFAGIGRWTEQHRYRLKGAWREHVLEWHGNEVVMETQFPVEPIPSNLML